MNEALGAEDSKKSPATVIFESRNLRIVRKNAESLPGNDMAFETKVSDSQQTQHIQKKLRDLEDAARVSSQDLAITINTVD